MTQTPTERGAFQISLPAYLRSTFTYPLSSGRNYATLFSYIWIISYGPVWRTLESLRLFLTPRTWRIPDKCGSHFKEWLRAATNWQVNEIHLDLQCKYGQILVMTQYGCLFIHQSTSLQLFYFSANSEWWEWACRTTSAALEQHTWRWVFQDGNDLSFSKLICKKFWHLCNNNMDIYRTSKSYFWKMNFWTSRIIRMHLLYYPTREHFTFEEVRTLISTTGNL